MIRETELAWTQLNNEEKAEAIALIIGVIEQRKKDEELTKYKEERRRAYKLFREFGDEKLDAILVWGWIPFVVVFIPSLILVVAALGFDEVKEGITWLLPFNEFVLSCGIATMCSLFFVHIMNAVHGVKQYFLKRKFIKLHPEFKKLPQAGMVNPDASELHLL